VLVSCLSYLSTVKMAVTCSSEHQALSKLHGITTQKTVLVIVASFMAWLLYAPGKEALVPTGEEVW
jgi:hypothetical protein